MKKSFILYNDQVEIFKELNAGQSHELILALFEYTKECKCIETEDKMVKLAFQIIKSQIDRDAARYAHVCEIRKENANKRWHKDASKSIQKDANASKRMHTGYDNDNDNVNDITPPISPPGDKLFDIFWSAYPRKVGKASAKKAWKKIKKPNTLLPQMLKAIEAQKGTDQWKKDNGSFIPYPATWLNGGRWDDEITVTMLSLSEGVRQFREYAPPWEGEKTRYDPKADKIINIG